MAVRLEAGGEQRGRAQAAAPAALMGLARALEDQEGRLLLWWPVGLAAGIAGYFALDFEPDWRLAALAAAGTGTLAIAASRMGRWPLALGLAVLAVCVGFALASARSQWVSAPVLAERTGPVMVEGVVRSLTARSDGRSALLIAPERIDGLADDRLPATVRVTLAADRAAGVEAGERIKVRAILLPPPGPVAPGAFDFAREAWFQRLGAVGFALSGVETLGRAQAGPATRVADALERLRSRIAARIRAAVEGDEGAIAAALLTGRRGAISETTLASLRDADLAHLLAISGLHMALVCGTVFGAVGLMLGVMSWLALRITVKKWAAAAALAAGLGYYLLAGGSVATERAFIMAAISLTAVMIDRPAITMRNVAIAATVTLALRPESLNQAGFQMSFGAVIALVAFYEAVRRARERYAGEWQAPRRPAAMIGWTMAAVAATTLVATIATGPIAAHHFNRVAVYGLIANLAAVPLAGFVVMPLGLMALAAMALGLERIPLDLMAAAIGYIVDVAALVTSWEGSVRLVPASPTAALALFAAGGLWMCLWRGWTRSFAIVPIIACVLVAANARQPGLLVAREADNVAIRDDGGVLSLARARAARYSAEQWLRRDGDPRTPAMAAGGAFRCDTFACAADGEGREVAYVLRRDVLAEECWRADIVVSRLPVTFACAAPLVIDLIDIRRRGPHAVYFGPDGETSVVTTSSVRGTRPWTGQGLDQ